MATKSKFQQSILDLQRALQFEKEAQKDKFYFSGIAKSFEVCLEYSWKHLKAQLDHEGVEALSPREVIKEAANLKWLDDLESWLRYLELRNLGVHDYFNLTTAEYIKVVKQFLSAIRKIG